MSKKSWKENLPEGWKFRMHYDLNGNGSAIFTGPFGERKRIKPSPFLYWDSGSESFGEAALRKLFELYPDLKSNG